MVILARYDPLRAGPLAVLAGVLAWVTGMLPWWLDTGLPAKAAFGAAALWLAARCWRYARAALDGDALWIEGDELCWLGVFGAVRTPLAEIESLESYAFRRPEDAVLPLYHMRVRGFRLGLKNGRVRHIAQEHWREAQKDVLERLRQHLPAADAR